MAVYHSNVLPANKKTPFLLRREEGSPPWTPRDLHLGLLCAINRLFVSSTEVFQKELEAIGILFPVEQITSVCFASGAIPDSEGKFAYQNKALLIEMFYYQDGRIWSESGHPLAAITADGSSLYP
jgi:hypothetical protein